MAKQAPSRDTIFSAIVRGLYEGRFAPGQRLAEADLMRDFKVSRGSVREGLSRLAAEGIITLTPHRGACIRSLSRVEAQDVLAVVEVLIGLVARQAASRLKTEEHREALQSSLKELIALASGHDFPGFIRARNRFYRTLVTIGGNTELGRLLPSMHVHLIRVQLRAYNATDGDNAIDDYREICKFVLAGDAGRAERAGRLHVQRVTRTTDRLSDETFAPNF
jgi:DNA-binding GntR family transcriptional regulator